MDNVDNLIIFIEDNQDDNFDIIFKRYEELSEKLEKRLDEIKNRKVRKIKG
jgi:hypothetical protein